MRKAFTMIELIFVIVIIGILAAVAIPKLAATRDDAAISADVANLKVCIGDVVADYTATGSVDLTIDSCASLNCFSVSDSNNELTVTSSGSDSYCSDAQTRATVIGLIGSHVYGGSRVSF